MASFSSSYQQNNAFSGIEPDAERRVVCESPKLFDVFINHRGPDVKQTLAIQLYNSLKQLGIRAFLDSQEKELGDSFTSIIKTAICSAKVHIAIFSKGYAQSPWCLAELVLMLQTQAKIIPVFYEVEPWELRHIEKGVYNNAFIEYQEKGRYLEKLDEWKEALRSQSFIVGEEFNSSSDCKSIVAAVQKEVRRKQSLHVATYPVGLDYLVQDFERRCLDENQCVLQRGRGLDYLVQDFERRCLDELVQDFENQWVLQKGREKGKANVLGIFGMGGAGKTTLAKELFNRKRSDYCRSSFLFDVREASARSNLPSLQLKLLKELFNEDRGSFTSIEEGRSSLKDNLQRSDPCLKFLIVVDDIDHVEQLDALLVMDILDTCGNILVIITTRDVGVLITAGITAGYRLKGIDKNYGRQLFCWHAFRQPHPRSGYEMLVENFLDVCGGLPLSLQVLGRHVHGRAHSYWSSELSKVRKTLPQDVKKRLKISFDALDGEEKQVFMDIACFFVDEEKSIAESVWETLGWNSQHALETLQDKCLVSLEKWGGLRMHDHLRDLGREMALELAPPHRLWRPQDLDLGGFKDILAKENVRCFHSIEDDSMGYRVEFFLGQSDTSVGTSSSLLWLQLQGNRRVKEQRSLPSWIPLQSLQCLHIFHCGQVKPLWKNRKQAPSHLKELIIYQSSLEELPDLFGILDSSENGGNSSSVKAPMSGLENLQIRGENLLTRILINGFHYTSLQSIELDSIENLRDVNLTSVSTLSCLDVTNCKKLKGLKGVSDLTNLVLLNISECPNLEFECLCLRGMKCLKKLTFDEDVKVKYFELDDCQIFETIEFGHQSLVKLSISDCPKIDSLPLLSYSRSLESILLDRCGKFEYLELFHCKKLHNIILSKSVIAGTGDLTKIANLSINSCPNLKSVSGNVELGCLRIRYCPELEELPTLYSQICLEELQISYCEKLQNIMLPTPERCRRIAGTGDLTKITNLYIDHCPNLKSMSGNVELRCLRISDCPELEELPTLYSQICLEELLISYCRKLQNIMLRTPERCRRIAGTGDLTKIANLSIDGCPNLKSVSGNVELGCLRIRYCPELEELPTLYSQICLEEMLISYCRKLQNIMLPTPERCRRIAGTGDLTKITNLYIDHCPNLKSVSGNVELGCLRISHCPELPTLCGQIYVEELKISYCEKLQSIMLPTQERCRRIARTGDLTKFANLSIDSCPNLKSVSGNVELGCLSISHCPELPTLCGQIYVEELKISYCEKLQNIMLPTRVIRMSVQSCNGLQRITGTGDLTKITNLYIDRCPNLKSLSAVTDCPELEELSTLSRQSCVEKFVINSCEKLENIAGIEELHVLEYMQLSCLSSAVIRNCVAKLKSVPSQFVFAISGAVEGAEATSNRYDFFLRKISVGRLRCNTVVNCFVVVLDDSESVCNLYYALSAYYSSRLELREGEWIITVVERYDHSEGIKHFLAGVLKKWYRVCVKEDEEWKIGNLVPTIVEVAMCEMVESKLGEMFSKLLE